MKILIADDELAFARAQKRLLEHRGYTVESVYDGEEALNFLSVSTVDVVLLDIMMPKMNGIEVLRHLRENGNNVPVIILTAKSSLDDRIEGLNLGADDFIVKPFEQEELLARIKAVTRRSQGVSQNVLTYGDTVLNRDTMELSYQGNSVRLSKKEFNIMEMLMGNPSKVHSTERILEGGWNLDADTDVHSVWTYIYALRKKLEDINSDLTINSSRGAGYTLSSDAHPDKG